MINEMCEIHMNISYHFTKIDKCQTRNVMNLLNKFTFYSIRVFLNFALHSLIFFFYLFFVFKFQFIQRIAAARISVTLVHEPYLEYF